MSPSASSTLRGVSTARPGAPKLPGALCAQCVLRSAPGPVRSELHGTGTAVLAEAPGKVEVQEGRPLVGPSGRLVMDALRATGLSRRDVSWINVVACRPPDNKLQLAVNRAARMRRAAVRAGADPADATMDPVACCTPRLERELAGHRNVLALGAFAARAVLGDTGPIQAIRGTLHEADGRRIAATVHPAFVLRRRTWQHVFRADVVRAVAFFRGQAKVPRPVLLHRPSAVQVTQFLDQHAQSPWLVVDVETIEADSPLCAPLRCIGIGTQMRAMVIPVFRMSTCRQLQERAAAIRVAADGDPRPYARAVRTLLSTAPWDFYAPAEAEEIKARLRTFLTAARPVKVGHNIGVFDRLVLAQHLDVEPAPLLDTLVLHKAAHPGFPHNLGFMAAQYTNTTAWKEKTDTLDDIRLAQYNSIDVANNAQCVVPLVRTVRQHNQRAAVQRDVAMQAVARHLHWVGMYVDVARAEWWAAQLRDRIRAATAECAAALRAAGVDAQTVVRDARRYRDGSEDEDGDPVAFGLSPDEHNPGSTVQVGRILYGLWDLPHAHVFGADAEAVWEAAYKDFGRRDRTASLLYTEAGVRSTSDAVLRAYLCDWRVNAAQKRYITALRQYRKARKLYTSEIQPLFRQRWPDGRVHGQWNILTDIGRFNSTAPNLQNRRIRDVFAAPEGRRLVYADMDQLHLRIIASLWQIPSLLLAFERGLDPHGLFAEVVLQEHYRNANGYRGHGRKPAPKSPAATLRDIAKRMRYAGAYGASPETIYRVLQAAEDDDGNLLNPDLTLEEVYALHNAWMQAEPQWAEGWRREREVHAVRRDGHTVELRSPLLKRRKTFELHDDNAIINYRVIATEGDIMGAITCELHAAVAAFRPTRRPAWLVHQGHDSLMVECDEADAPAIAQIMREIMNRRIPGFDVPFTADVTVQRAWGVPA